MSMPGPAQKQPGRFSLGAALLILVGVVLLLPGLCAVFSAFMMLPIVGDDLWAMLGLSLLWAVCILISYAGIRLVVRASRKSHDRPAT